MSQGSSKRTNALRRFKDASGDTVIVWAVVVTVTTWRRLFNNRPRERRDVSVRLFTSRRRAKEWGENLRKAGYAVEVCRRSLPLDWPLGRGIWRGATA
jgi:hypothetical protein